jgi:hypothetical protein
MWHTFIIPLVGRIAAVAVGAVLAFVALLKARTIGVINEENGRGSVVTLSEAGSPESNTWPSPGQ